MARDLVLEGSGLIQADSALTCKAVYIEFAPLKYGSLGSKQTAAVVPSTTAITSYLCTDRYINEKTAGFKAANEADDWAGLRLGRYFGEQMAVCYDTQPSVAKRSLYLYWKAIGYYFAAHGTYLEALQFSTFEYRNPLREEAARYAGLSLRATRDYQNDPVPGLDYGTLIKLQNEMVSELSRLL